MAAEENKARIRRCVDEAFNAGNLAVVDQTYAARPVSHAPRMPAEPHHPEDVRQFVTLYRSAFPDLRTSIDDMMPKGTASRPAGPPTVWHHGDLMGIPPTHKQVTITGLTLEHLADGQIVDEWNSWDHVGLLPPLGTLPAPGQAAR